MSQSAFYDLAVIDNVPFGLTGSQGRFFALRLERPDWKSWAPGQFVMLRPQGWALDMPWARPFSICRVSTNELVIFFQVAGRGTEKMAKLRRGDKVHLWGPLGNRFAVEGGTPTLLLAGGIGIAPFVGYAERHPTPGVLSMVFGHRLPEDCYPVESLGERIDVESFLKNKLPRLPWHETPVIANLYATSPAEFAELAGILAAEEGIAGLEVNISCPNVKNGGVLFGQDPALAAEVTEAVKKHAGNLPVIVKLSPNVTDITAIAKAAEQAGADAISCINTITGMGVDVKTRKPLLANVVGGLSGPAVKPVALRCVWQVCNAVKIPVIGIGGITCAQDVLEFILVGAHAVEIGTMNFVRPDAAFRIAEELPHLCQQLGIKSLAEFRGTLQQ